MRRVSTYIYDDTPCSFSLNLNLLNSPCILGLLRVFAVTILSFSTLFVSRPTSVSSHRFPEHPPPKHSFLFTCCAWFPYSVSAYLLWTSFSYTRLPQRNLFPSIALPKPLFYIHLRSYATNTAWSMHYIVTYLRRPHCMYLLRLTRVEANVDSLDEGVLCFLEGRLRRTRYKGDLRGFLKWRRCWGLPQLLLATVGCYKEFKVEGLRGSVHSRVVRRLREIQGEQSRFKLEI